MNLKLNKNDKPVVIDNIEIDNKEFCYYLYLPIKVYKDDVVYCGVIEKYKKLIDKCIEDYKNVFGIENYKKHYIYLTLKRMYQKNGAVINRSGWHLDGYKENLSRDSDYDINYIWSDKQPTIFNNSDFSLSNDDTESMIDMEKQALLENNYNYENNTLLRLNPFIVHKVGIPIEGPRTFFKLSFSKNKYNLEGNSRNYDINYTWKMYPRSKKRNIPDKTESVVND